MDEKNKEKPPALWVSRNAGGFECAVWPRERQNYPDERQTQSMSMTPQRLVAHKIRKFVEPIWPVNDEQGSPDYYDRCQADAYNLLS
jgi:hypothetical protein